MVLQQLQFAPCIILVKAGALIPKVPVAQSTDKIDWDKLTIEEYKVEGAKPYGLIYKPGDSDVREITN